jgi:hypothetical protein
MYNSIYLPPPPLVEERPPLGAFLNPYVYICVYCDTQIQENEQYVEVSPMILKRDPVTGRLRGVPDPDAKGILPQKACLHHKCNQDVSKEAFFDDGWEYDDDGPLCVVCDRELNG